MEKNKTRKVITVILGIAVVALLIGTSYSVWHYNFSGNNNKLATGEVKLELLESATNVIQIDKGFPLLDEVGIASDETFDFAVSTETSMKKDIAYELYVENLNEYVLCSSLQNPSRDKNPECYFTITEEEKKAIIDWMNNSDYWCENDDGRIIYDLITNHDKEGLIAYYKNDWWSDDDIYDVYISKIEANGYEETLINSYEDATGKEVNESYDFNGNNKHNPGYLTDSQIKIYLTDYEDNVIIGPTTISNLNNYSLNATIHTHSKDKVKQTDKYKLRAWIDENVGAASWDETTNFEYKFKIGVRTVSADGPTLVSGARFNEILEQFSWGLSEVRGVKFLTGGFDTSDAQSEIYDVSEAGDGSIVAWFDYYTNFNTRSIPSFTLFVATESNFLYANPDSSYMFDEWWLLNDVYAENLITSKVTNMSNMLSTGLTKVYGIENWDVSNVTNMMQMFKGIYTETELNLQNWDVSNVTNMREMFKNAYQLKSLNLSGWDTSKVIDATDMFCGAITSDLLLTGPKWTLGNEIFSCTLPEDETE